MPIPALNEHGFLPEGVHTCTLEEIQKRFGSFTISDHRVKLFNKLLELIAQAKATNLIIEVIIDGSFVTDKLKPNDIDLILVLHESVKLDFSIDMLPKDYNALSKKRLAKIYGFDVRVETKGSFAHNLYVNFFQNVKESDLRKGVLRIEL